MAPRTSPLARASKQDILAVQKELFSLGLYRLNLDGALGAGTEAALVEAYGGDAWRSLTAGEIRQQLADAEPPLGTRGEHRLRYGALCQRSLVEVTLGVGYDEQGLHRATMSAFDAVLATHGFAVDQDAAARLYAASGRAAPDDPEGSFYVREDALTYRPPVGDARSVHVVVRLLANNDGTRGGETAKAFRDGLLRSDVTYYAGHGRYGSGPDFDPNMTYELLDERGEREGDVLTDYDLLEKQLADEGAPHGRNAWAQFLHRVGSGRLRVHGVNAGNVFLNPVNHHSGEFGGRLMYWNLARSGDQGAVPATGRGGVLARADARVDYQLWVFNGCRTDDYVKSIRATPSRDARLVDLIVTKRLAYFDDLSPTLDAFLHGFLHQHTAEQIVRAMDARNVTLRTPGDVFAHDGIGDNPIVR